ncbi:aspartate kinase [Isobaculum melis]|nr:aspartate kinase [Isobaculum melis]
MKVTKFGGSSLASASQLEKVLHIMREDATRKFMIVSAPGKRFAEDEKVTDLLIELGEAVLAGTDTTGFQTKIMQRYQQIADDLKLTDAIMEEIKAQLEKLLTLDVTSPEAYLDAVKSSGEDNHARLIAAYFNQAGLKAHYVNPLQAGMIVTNEPGNAQILPQSYTKIATLRQLNDIIVIPGFFGYTETGRICTFSRGGSDITGSIIANGVQASLYENFTDVDAIYAANPHIVSQPKEIAALTYREMRELSYAGFSVFHDEALIPAFKAGIPVQVKNTNNPTAPGTTITTKRQAIDTPVVGIASDSGFCGIYIRKYLMNREIGFGRHVLEILEDCQLNFEHMPSGIDELTIILREDQLTEAVKATVLNRLKQELAVDEVKIQHHLALIMVVGEGMNHNVGITAKAATSLANAAINIEMINQGSSEVSIMFGVKEADEKKALQVIYQAFFD